MSIPGVDYAGDHPTASGLAAAGKRFACRYGGPGGDWKALTLTEALSLVAAGISIVANAEGAEDGLLGGWSVGAAWAREADAHFRACGMPADRPIYLSVDFPCSSGQWPAVANALKGAASVIGLSRVGVYGSDDVMRWARRDNVAKWFWQTYAWSGGRWEPGNHIEQYLNKVSLAGGTVDLDRALTVDYGQWGVEGTSMLTQEDRDRMLHNADRHLSADLTGAEKVTGVIGTDGVSRDYALLRASKTALAAVKADTEKLLARPAVDAQALAVALVNDEVAMGIIATAIAARVGMIPTAGEIARAVGALDWHGVVS